MSMKPAYWMVTLSAVSALVAVLMTGGRFAVEIFAGMLGPLAVAVGSWLQVEQAYMRRPEALTAVLMKGFAAKVLFFGAYVAIALTTLSLRPVPFVASFTGYFIALYAAEAMLMRRLFTSPVEWREQHEATKTSS